LEVHGISNEEKKDELQLTKKLNVDDIKNHHTENKQEVKDEVNEYEDQNDDQEMDQRNIKENFNNIK